MPVMLEKPRRSDCWRAILILLAALAVILAALGVAAMVMPMEPIALDVAEPLTQAAVAGNTTQVAALLQSGISVDSRCADGRTSLILATMLGHEPTVNVLLANGADVTLRGRDGRTALQWSRRSRHFGIENLLKQAGALQ